MDLDILARLLLAAVPALSRRVAVVGVSLNLEWCAVLAVLSDYVDHLVAAPAKQLLAVVAEPLLLPGGSLWPVTPDLLPLEAFPLADLVVYLGTTSLILDLEVSRTWS